MSKISSKLKESPIGLVPEDWLICPIEEILSNILDFRGKTPKKLGMEWGNGEIPALSANNVEMGKVNLLKETYYGSEELYKKWMNKGDTEQGDIIITMEAPLGNIAQIPDNRKYILSQRVLLFKSKQEIIFNDFLKHLLMSDNFQALLKSFASGTTATGIQQAKLVKLYISVPNITEQQKIAEILDTIDSTINRTEALIAKLKQVKAGLLHDLLTCGLDENGKLRDPVAHPEQFKDSGIEAIGLIPKDWEIKAAKEVCLAVVDCKNRTPPITADGYPVIRTPNVRNGTFVYENLQFTDYTSYLEWTKKGIPRPNDIVITREAPIGEVCLIPSDMSNACLGQRMMMYQVDSNIIRANFMLLSLISQPVQSLLLELAGGSTVGHVKVGDIHNLCVHVPPIEEQRQIAEFISNQDILIQQEEAYRDKLKQQKKGLMHDLLTGKIRVNLDDK